MTLAACWAMWISPGRGKKLHLRMVKNRPVGKRIMKT